MEEEWQPRVYERFDGTVDTIYGEVEYHGVKRDWNIVRNTPEQNRARSPFYELVSRTSSRVVGAGATHEAARIDLANRIEGAVVRSQGKRESGERFLK